MLTLASYYAETETGTLRKITLPLPYIIEEIQRTLESQSAQAEPTRANYLCPNWTHSTVTLSFNGHAKS